MPPLEIFQSHLNSGIVVIAKKKILKVVILRPFLLCESDLKLGLRSPFLSKLGITAMV